MTLGGEINKFWNPFFDIETFWIKFFLLCPRIEYAEIRLGVAASTCHPLPIPIVQGRVIIDQFLSKVFFSPSPINMQVFDKKGCGDKDCKAKMSPLLSSRRKSRRNKKRDVWNFFSILPRNRAFF